MIIHRRCVRVGTQNVSYKVAGEGEAVVLVHGLSCSTRWWSRTVPALADRYQVYLVDLPGFGGMRRYATDFALAAAADWLYAWMRAVGLSSAHVVGHSMGGFVAVSLAARYPQVVERLVLIDAVGVPTNRSILHQLLPLVAEGIHFTPAFLPIIAYDALRAGPRTLWRAASSLLSEDARRNLKAIKAPTLLIWGERDHLMPLSLSYVFCEEIPAARLHVIKKAHHVPMIERPAEFNRVLTGFLSQDAPPETA